MRFASDQNEVETSNRMQLHIPPHRAHVQKSQFRVLYDWLEDKDKDKDKVMIEVFKKTVKIIGQN